VGGGQMKNDERKTENEELAILGSPFSVSHSSFSRRPIYSQFFWHVAFGASNIATLTSAPDRATIHKTPVTLSHPRQD
jgi:hypothetical protein